MNAGSVLGEIGNSKGGRKNDLFPEGPAIPREQTSTQVKQQDNKIKGMMNSEVPR
jgi:hypothetical protein